LLLAAELPVVPCDNGENSFATFCPVMVVMAMVEFGVVW
jgi:hypothetical protein